MTPHLTNRDMELFANNNLPPAELLAIDSHLAECDRCRSSLLQISGGSEKMHDLRRVLSSDLIAAHLTYEELASCADGASESAGSEHVRSHLKSCAECRDEISQFVTLRKSDEGVTVPITSESRPNFFISVRSFFRPRIATVGVAVLLACVAIGAWLISRRQVDDKDVEIAVNAGKTTEPANNASSSNAVGEAARTEISNGVLPANNAANLPADAAANTIRDDGGNIGLDRSGRLVGYDDLSAKHREMLERSLRSQIVETGPEINELKRPSGTLMGGTDDAKNRFHVYGPFGKVISTDHPTISWEASAGAENYAVEVYDANFNKVTDSGVLKSTTWSPKLPRGRTYILQVIALKDGVEIKAPQRPEPEARFHILNPQNLAEIESAKRAHPRASLLLGLLYAKYGMLDEAEQKFRILLKHNPRSATVRKLLEKVQRGSSR